jgi:hypothetical protein
VDVLTHRPAKALLFSVSAEGNVERREVTEAQLASARARFLEELKTLSVGEAWTRFIVRLKTP